MHVQRCNWNLAARRAFESIELTIKATHLLLGEPPRKVHGEQLPSRDKLDFIPLIAWRARMDPLSSIAVIVDRAKHAHEATRVFKCVSGVLTLLSQPPGLYRANLQLMLDGSSLHLISGGLKVDSLTDTTHGGLLDGHWVSVALTASQLKAIDAARRRVATERDGAFYLEHHIAQKDSDALVASAMSIFSSVRRHAGYDLSGMWTQ